MIRTQIQLTDDQAEKLKDFSASHHQSMAETIRQAVDTFMTERSGRNVADARKKAIAAAGKFKSGMANLSEDHDEHLAGAFGE